MTQTERTPIVRRAGVTIYGRVVNPQGKLGKFEVISNLGHEGDFATFSDAEDRFNYLVQLREKK